MSHPQKFILDKIQVSGTGAFTEYIKYSGSGPGKNETHFINLITVLFCRSH